MSHLTGCHIWILLPLACALGYGAGLTAPNPRSSATQQRRLLQAAENSAEDEEFPTAVSSFDGTSTFRAVQDDGAEEDEGQPPQ